jgi:hypothetical protein
MAKTKKTKTTEKRSALYKDLLKAIKKWERTERTTFLCAFRDALTDMRHLADDSMINFADRLEIATALYKEENEIAEVEKASP